MPVTTSDGGFLSDHEIQCPKCLYVEDLLVNPENGHIRPNDCAFIRGWFRVGEHDVPCFQCGFNFWVIVHKRGERFRFHSQGTRHEP